ncbi:MAG: response regulator transcription factor [Duncaniella sp.]|nr:response regulator transcription factor [Duncaniella sp.]MDE5916043.1 response regulator transcription factor [Duncaniella sp.]
MKTLLVVDDHPIVLEGIESVLSGQGYKILKASSSSEALTIAGHIDGIDMFVIDLSLSSNTDGLTLAETLRDRGIDKPVIIYTMHEELWNISLLMKADVQGIVFKGETIDELIHAIDIVGDGKTYTSPAFDSRRREAMQTNGILSAKDIEVLRLLSDGKMNREIACAMDISEKTVEYHRGNILRKLCSKTMPEAIRRAINLGIVH